jgi:anti-sigma-K factor RskA
VHDHQEFDELAVGWALHALEPADEAAFAVHLPGCARCAATVAQATEVMAAMAADLPQAEPSEGLRARLRDAVGSAEQLPAPPPAPVPAPDRPASTAGVPGGVPVHLSRAEDTPRWRRALPAALAAAAVAAIVGLGLWNVILSSDREKLQSAVATQSEVMEAVMSPGRATIARLNSDGRPMATVVARDGELQVVTSGLPVNDAGSTTYVVWGLPAGEAPVALGAFDVQRSQMDLQTVGSGRTGLDDFAQYGISLEPGQEPPPAPTEVVAMGQVTS